jgi:CBS domain-containing protein
MEVRTIMMRPVVVVREDTTLEEMARMMLERHIGCVPVVNDRGEICGIVTESDFTAKQRGIPFSTFRAPQILGQWMPKQGIERIYEAARTMTAREIMTARVVTVTEEKSVEEVVELVLRHNIHRVPVVRDAVPVGIVARHDILKLMVGDRVPK